ncbi:cellulose biosynthesis protein BcsF [uncultured Cedecea sp.]|uniref:cellulose biosynthesis protein BcsF n=1 Tax=uncultured Cedecea sp. TaxID=988762 RepID=UPI00345D8DF2
MMNSVDIIQLIILCAIIFIPAGYILKSRLPALRAVIRLRFLKPRFIKPYGILHQSSAKTDKKNDA